MENLLSFRHEQKELKLEELYQNWLIIYQTELDYVFFKNKLNKLDFDHFCRTIFDSTSLYNIEYAIKENENNKND